MLLHKITWIEDSRKKTLYCGSKAEAGSERKLIRQRPGYLPNSVQTSGIDVPTKKAGLLRYLNKYCCRN